MLFCSIPFLHFFTATFALYWISPGARLRVWVLLGASFAFYATWSAWLSALILATTTADYFLARGIEGSDRPGVRKFYLIVSIVGNVGMLCYFKYVHFFLASLHDALAGLGVASPMPVLDLLVPLGISFYTFEAISYVVDVYQGRTRAERNLANLLLFITFFPHLLAGPIVRARDFLPQVRRCKRWSWPRLNLAMQFFILGIVKKFVIADRMAAYVDPVFADPSAYNTDAVWIAMFAYALQIYGDFSGYSDMAIGLAHAFGFRLCKNFDLPYLAPNVTEFWRRWHISLSSWFRDYVFFSLGGSRGGTLRTSANLLFVMVLCGLWHGAGWPFVIFGLLQGCALVVHRLFRQWCATQPLLERALGSGPGTAFRIITTFTLFCCTLIVFRTASLDAGWTMLSRLVVPSSGQGAPLREFGFVATLLAVLAGSLVAQRGGWKIVMDRLPSPVRGFTYATSLSLALMLSPEANRLFIYFQF